MEIHFVKMHGLGNDFAVIDQIDQEFGLTPERVRAMADRRTGVGFDQLLVIEKPHQVGVDVHCRIFNSDGSEVAQCGNGMRCVVRYVIEHRLVAGPAVVVSTNERVMRGHWDGGDQVTVDMGIPDFSAEGTPLVLSNQPNPPYRLTHGDDEILFYTANVGNPHAVIVVDEHVSEVIESVGLWLSTHSAFPEGTNVGFLKIFSSEQGDLVVYERGAGLTQACGSGACAAMVVAHAQGLLGKRAHINQPGGALIISWQGIDQAIEMTGPAALVYRGVYTLTP